jgi:hypothetical protein
MGKHWLIFLPCSIRALQNFSTPVRVSSKKPKGPPDERDDHAHADEHIGENYSGAALDGRDARRRFASMPLHGQSSGSPRGFMH